jgi:hypothetical protein
MTESPVPQGRHPGRPDDGKLGAGGSLVEPRQEMHATRRVAWDDARVTARQG